MVRVLKALEAILATALLDILASTVVSCKTVSQHSLLPIFLRNPRGSTYLCPCSHLAVMAAFATLLLVDATVP